MATATVDREVVLQTRALTKRFGGVRAVHGVNLTIPRGDLRAIIGPNGAGKTTLFNLITGDIRHDSGLVYFGGQEISALPPHEVCRRGIGRTFQITSVFRRLTVLENVQTALLSHHRRHYNLFARAAHLYRDGALALLERVGLGEQAPKPSGILSHGDQRRLELAIALASEPRLLMLDEPTAGMAPRERHQLMGLVARIAADTGVTVLFTEHDMDVVFAVARRITVMHQGSVIVEGAPPEIRLDPEVQRIYLGYTKAR
ncbi:MAG: ABC transporter ATP-binding protein [Candidatus Rokubacteria bacterium]|nr:ABC transporter ATP-binding protein [Candidatus Rokubacteria bacterium]MBI3827536.1 ABC transporter ATP-binding protein [Candidatus Rokubacteria bacterium]